MVPPESSTSAGGTDASGNYVPAVAGQRIKLIPGPDGRLNLAVPVALARGIRLISFLDPVTGVALTDTGLIIPIKDTAGQVMMNLVATVRPLTGTGTSAEGIVDKLEMVTQPLAANMTPADARIGTVAFQMRAELKNLPNGAQVRMLLSHSPDLATRNAFNLAASRAGNQVNDIAFVAEVRKAGLVDGKDIGTGTVTLTVGKNWADGTGIRNVAVAVLSDDGSVDLLPTDFVRYTSEGQAVFSAVSRRGVSTFGLVALENVPPTPTPTPTFYTLQVVNNTPDLGTVVVEPVTPGFRYQEGTTVALRAVANQGRKFDYWEGSASGITSRIEITMDSNKTVQAVFSTLTYTINSDVLPRGGGTVTLDPYLVEYDYGTKVTARADANPGYAFQGWSGDISTTANPVTITVDGSKAITANFSTVRYTYTTSVQPPGAGSVSPPNGTLDVNSTVSLAAVPFQGYAFSFWSGDVSGTDNPLVVRMDHNKTIVANFVRGQYYLTTQAQPFMAGTVAPSSGNYEYGQAVTLSAIPNTGYYFSGWSGDASGSDNPKTITITKNTNVIASFVQKTYKLNVNINPNPLAGYVGYIDPAANDTYPSGKVVSLSAIPNGDYMFVNWSGDFVSSSPLITITMDRNYNLTANFRFVATPIPPR